MRITPKIKSCMLLLLFAGLLSGCMSTQQTRTKSSVVDYLYPSNSGSIIQPSIPVLNIPLTVGIAFVPDQASRYSRRSYLTEIDKSQLLDRVADNFRKLEYVADIEVIPSAYLTKGGGFQNLDQIKTMYGIDVIALVSYDQAQFTDEGLLSLTYWTLIGAYIVSGEKNDTSTMMDTAVYDIQSRKMLFRAPGTSNIKSRSTPINLSEELRADSINGFKTAADMMISNLDIQLNLFREKIKTNSEKAKVVYQPGYSGGGVFTMVEFFLLLVGWASINQARFKSRE